MQLHTHTHTHTNSELGVAAVGLQWSSCNPLDLLFAAYRWQHIAFQADRAHSASFFSHQTHTHTHTHTQHTQPREYRCLCNVNKSHTDRTKAAKTKI